MGLLSLIKGVFVICIIKVRCGVKSDMYSVCKKSVHLHNPVFTNQKKALSLQDKTKRHGSHEGIVEDAVTR